MDIYRYFKYRSVNKNLIDSIVNGSLYFSLPTNLNDPFDCQVDIRKSVDYSKSKVCGIRHDILNKISQLDGFIDDIHLKMKQVGVCSFSLALEEPLLWSHYADEHRGICLMYEFPEDFLLDRKNEIVGVSEIIYDENPLSDWLLEVIPDQLDQIRDDFYENFTTELLKRVLIIKATAWDYEKECRIIREKAGSFQFPKEFLKQICFGMRVSESDKKLIMKIAESSGYNIDYCQIKKTECDFGIKAVEI